MAKRKNILPFATLGTLIQEATGKRVSQDAKECAEEILDELAEKVVKRAVLLAEHAGRKTIRDKDLMLAYRQIREGNK